MGSVAVTHSGPFHADDVMAWALLTVFHDAPLELRRTRDRDAIEAAHLVFDVGGRFDPAERRFDHHQAAYTGRLSSAGMVLEWLEARGRVEPELADRLRAGAVHYVDDVDNGRRVPDPAVPCFSRIVDAIGAQAASAEQFDELFGVAAEVGAAWIRGQRAVLHRVRAAYALVRAQMEEAVAEGRNALLFDDYLKWQEPYFALGGEDHPTEYCLFPGTDGSWRIVAIPPVQDDFGQKRSLPKAWAGLTGDELVEVVGVSDARFCHKNLFLAVFETRAGALEALDKHGRLWR